MATSTEPTTVLNVHANSRTQSRTDALKMALISASVLLAICHAWAQRFAMNPDGVPYLDVASAYLRGDFGTAQNSTWSPLYSCYLALVFKLVHSTSVQEFVVAHLANIPLFIVTMFAFNFFWTNVVRWPQTGAEEGESLASLAPVCWWVIGYVLFTTYFAIMVEKVTPDMMVAGFVFLSAGLLQRIAIKGPSVRLMMALGATLGTGYLAKAILFPIGCGTMLVLVALLLIQKRSPLRAGLAIATFLLVCSPLLIWISSVQHHFSFGESGRLVYAWNVNHVGGTGALDNGKHFPIGRVISVTPDGYEIPVREGVTFAPWYDPSIQGSAVHGHFNLRDEGEALYRSYKAYRDIFLVERGSLTVALLVLLVLGGVFTLSALPRNWPVVLVAVAGLGLYALVLVEARYIAAFEILLWGALFGGLRFTKSGEQSRFAAMTLQCSLVVVILLTAPTLVSPLLELGHKPARESIDVAEGLLGAGLQPGERVAVVGDASWQFWARAARLRISGVIPEREAGVFWGASRQKRTEILRALANTGAKVVVARDAAVFVGEGWQRIGMTAYYKMSLQ